MCGHAVCDIAPTSKIMLREDLIIGANLRKGSHAESCLKMQEQSVLTVNGRFQIFGGGSVELFSGAELSLGKGYINAGAAIACAHSMVLGDGVFVARNVYITDSDHHRIFAEDGTVANPPRPSASGIMS